MRVLSSRHFPELGADFVARQQLLPQLLAQDGADGGLPRVGGVGSVSDKDPLHADLEALVEATGAAPCSYLDVDVTAPLLCAGVGQVVSYCALEKCLAAFAGGHPIVDA